MRSNQMTELFLFQRCMEADACSTEIIVWKNPEADSFRYAWNLFVQKSKSFHLLVFCWANRKYKKETLLFYMNGIAYLFFTTLITIVKCHSSMPARLNKWYNTSTSFCSWNPPKNSVMKDIYQMQPQWLHVLIIFDFVHFLTQS